MGFNSAFKGLITDLVLNVACDHASNVRMKKKSSTVFVLRPFDT